MENIYENLIVSKSYHDQKKYDLSRITYDPTSIILLLIMLPNRYYCYSYKGGGKIKTSQ